jgi:hypothetical protein
MMLELVNVAMSHDRDAAAKCCTGQRNVALVGVRCTQCMSAGMEVCQL